MAGALRVDGSAEGICTIECPGAEGGLAEELRMALSHAERSCRRVLVDLGEAQCVDSLVLGALLGGDRRLRRSGAELAVLCTHLGGFADLNRAAVSRLMPIFSRPEDADEWLRQPAEEPAR